MKKTAYGSWFFQGARIKRPSESPQTLYDFNQSHKAKGNWLPAQMFRVMRMLAFLLFTAFLSAQATGTAQSVTLSGKDITLKQVFSAIETQTGYAVFYNKEMLENSKPLSLTVYNMPLTDILKLVLSNQSLEYVIQGKTIILSKQVIMEKTIIPNTPNKQFYYIAPNTNIINGVVLSITGEPLVGATINVKGKKVSSVTDNEGKFSIQAETGDVLTISYVGYEKQEVKLHNSYIVVNLKVSVSLLDEAQITAYGKTSRRLSTGSISTVKAEEIERQPVFTALEALAGRVPGIIIKSTGNSAAPMSVEIRGRNTINPEAITDPLYVIDGIPLIFLNANSFTESSNVSMGAVQGGLPNTGGENPLLSINPRDIESISVLKDADATAIYGSRGANGVILITTKRGKPGSTKFDVNIVNGLKYIQKYPKLLNTQEYLAVRKEAFQNDAITPDIYNAQDLLLWDQNKYTDWQKEAMGVGNVTNLDLGISGGIAQTSYGITLGLSSQKELLNNDGKNQRLNLRSYFGHYSQDRKLNVNISNNISLADVSAYLTGNILSLAPNAPEAFDENGNRNFRMYRTLSGSFYPFGSLLQNSESNSFSLQSNIKIGYEIVRGLNLSLNTGYNLTTNNNVSYKPAEAMDPYFGAAAFAIYGNSATKSWLIEPQLAYNNMIGNGRLSVQLLGSAQHAETKGETAMGFGFPNDLMMKSINNAASITISEGYKEYKYISAAAILNYTWDNKYIINLNGRRDGSSRFGRGRQFGNFGSIGLGWIMSQESWFTNNAPVWLSFAKLRGSYGLTGRDAIGEYEYLSRWSKQYTIGGSSATLPAYNGVNAFHAARPLNQEFQWETTTKFDLAIAMGFLNEKIMAEINYYRNLSGNQLTEIPTGNYTGFNSVKGNWDAVIANKGLEISVSANIVESKKWNISMNFNVGVNRNKLVDYPGLELSPYAKKYEIGKPLYLFYALHYLGVDPLTGNYTFEDHNKDGKINYEGNTLPTSPMDDRYVFVDLQEKYAGGFGININYNRLSMSAQFSYVNRLVPNPFLNSTAGSMNNMILPDDVLENHWKQPGDQAKYARFSTNNSFMGGMQQSDAYYTDGSFLRWSNLSLAYQLPTKWIKKVGMKNAGISMNTQNLLTITAFKGYDPDIPSFNNVTPLSNTIVTRLFFNF